MGDGDGVAAAVRFVRQRALDLREGVRTREGVVAVAEQAADYAGFSAQQAAGMLKKLEARMYKHAQNLEFEDAARLRDQIHQLREQALR